VVPDTNTQSPCTTAREYPISASNVEPELMSFRAVVMVLMFLLDCLFWIIARPTRLQKKLLAIFRHKPLIF
jgi:hypothetical protein